MLFFGSGGSGFDFLQARQKIFVIKFTYLPNLIEKTQDVLNTTL